MKENKEVKISYWAHHLTTVVSVSLVLVLVGIIAMIWISAEKESRRLRESVELSVVMKDSVSDAQAEALAHAIEARNYSRQVKVISKEQALQNWTAETGENLSELFGVNPLSPEIALTLKQEYANPQSLGGIVRSLERNSLVESVSAPDADVIDSMNSNIATLTLVLGVVAVVMLVISFVLINNTVHLAIYSRRFTIHTMQLVGATKGFIRRPIILNNMLAGLMAGIFSAAIMAAAMVGASQAGMPDVMSYISWPVYGIVAAALVILGMCLCSFAAWIAADKYLRKDYDALFR